MYWFLNWISFYKPKVCFAKVEKQKDIEIQNLKIQLQKYESMISAIKHSIDCSCK